MVGASGATTVPVSKYHDFITACHLHLNFRSGVCLENIWEVLLGLAADKLDDDWTQTCVDQLKRDLHVEVTVSISKDSSDENDTIDRSGNRRDPTTQVSCQVDTDERLRLVGLLTMQTDGSRFRTLCESILKSNAIFPAGGLECDDERWDLVLKTLVVSWVIVELQVSTISLDPIPCSVRNSGHRILLKGFPVNVGDMHAENNDTVGLALLRAVCKAVSPDAMASFATPAPQLLLLASSSVFCSGIAADALLGKTFGTTLNEAPRLEAHCRNDWKEERMVVMEANIDDMTAERFAFMCERLLQAGAADAWTSPIGMKKSRPATQVNCLVHESQRDEMMQLMFELSTTLGVRTYSVNRFALQRKLVTVQTRWTKNDVRGRVDVKLGLLNGKVITHKAEFDHCRLIASSKEEATLESVAAEAAALALEMASENGLG